MLPLRTALALEPIGEPLRLALSLLLPRLARRLRTVPSLRVRPEHRPEADPLAGADRTQQLHGVEAQHRADQGGAHGERRGEPAARTRDHVGHRVERTGEGGVRSRQRDIDARQHRAGDGRDSHPGRREPGPDPAGGTPAPVRRAPHCAAPAREVPSSTVETRRCPSLQVGPQIADPVPEPVKHRPLARHPVMGQRLR